MANTLYASFADPSLAEKAAGALLDHGVRAEDISLVQNHEATGTQAGSVAGSTYGVENTTTAHGTSRITNDDRNLDDVDNMNARGTMSGANMDNDNDVIDAADSGIAGAKSMGSRGAEYGDRAMAAGADMVGAEGAQANYESAADRRDAIADSHAARSENEMRDAVDMPGTSTTGYGQNIDTTGGMSTGSGIATGGAYGTTGNTSTGPQADNDNDMVDVADAGIAGTKSAGNRMTEYGDRAMAAGADMVGAEGTQANYEAAADRRDAIADNHAARSGNEMRDAADMDNNTTSGMGSGSMYGTGAGYSTGSTMGTSDRSDDINRVDAKDLNDTEHAAKQGISTTTAADAGSGAITGTGIGLGVGAIAALASLLVPGVGLVVGGGALAAALGGIAASAGAGAVAGAVTGYLKDQGMDEHVAVEYDRVVSGGGALLAIHVPSGNVDEAEATQILTKYGATNVRSYATTGGAYMG